jgi:PAS domain S-box-containing protein
MTLNLNGSTESDTRYRGLLEAAPDAMVVVNQDGGIVLLNVQAEKQFGYQRDELLGQKVTSIIPEGFAERLIADGTRTPNEALAQQIGMGIELSGRRKDGSRFPIEIMLSPLESAEGILVTAAIRNITTRKDSEARYRGLLEAAPDAMVVVNQAGEIVLVNAQVEKQFGYRRDELVGQKIKKIIPEGFAERLIADATRSTAEALAQHIGAGIELSGRRKDGTEFPIEMMLSPLESAEGILVTAAIRNISARKAAEAHLAKAEGKRHFVENSLRESEERYRMLLDGIEDYAIFMMDPRGQILSWNAGAELIKGYRADEIIGQNFSCFFPPEDIEQGRPEEILRLTSAGGRHEEQGMRVRKDGSRFLASLTFTALYDQGGDLRGFSEFSHDLTESKESAAKYRGLLEAAPDAMVVVNEAGEIVLVNVQAEKQFGYRRDELVGQKVMNIIPEGFAERLIADATRSTAEALAQQIGMGIELSGRRKDGTEFPIEIMLSPLESTEGILVTAAIRNITMRKDAERHLGQMEGRYRGLLEAAPDAMVVVNEAGEIVLVNAQVEKQFRYRRDELVGRKIMNIIPEGFAERLIADAARSTAEALAQHIGAGIELSGRRKDGTEFPLEMMLSPLVSAEGTLVTAAIRNISARKKSEQELAVASQVLEESNLELKQFAYVASHDLQTPLRSITGFVQLLQQEYEGKLGEQAQDWIRRTVLAVARMQTLISDLLSYSRVEAHSRPFTQIPFLDVVNDALVLLESSIHDSGGQVACGKLPIVMGDRSQLVQLMQNLIGNGLAYRSDKRPHIHISAKRSGKDWIFSISDNGIGIDPKYYKQIFEIFKRLHNQKDKPGTGIGLAVCRRVVNRHGGKIWVESEPGHGSTFHFTIPEGTEQTNEQSTR